MLWGEIYIFVTYRPLSLVFESQRKHVVRTIDVLFFVSLLEDACT